MVTIAVERDQTTARRRLTQLCIAVLVVSAVVNKIGEASAPTLLANAPLLLVAASPNAKYVLLASGSVATVPLLLVALARRMLLQPVVYGLGRMHGRSMLGWFDRNFRRIGRMMRAIERWFGRWPSPVTVAFPGGLTMFLAGDIRMRLPRVLALTAVGLSMRIGFTLWLGEVFSGPVESFVGFVGGNQGVLTVLTIGLTVLHLLRSRQRSRPIKVRPMPTFSEPAPLDPRRLVMRGYGPLAAVITILVVVTLVVPARS